MKDLYESVSKLNVVIRKDNIQIKYCITVRRDLLSSPIIQKCEFTVGAGARCRILMTKCLTLMLITMNHSMQTNLRKLTLDFVKASLVYTERQLMLLFWVI